MKKRKKKNFCQPVWRGYLIVFRLPTSEATSAWREKVKQMVKNHQGIYHLMGDSEITQVSLELATKLTVDEMMAIGGECVAYSAGNKQLQFVV